jgi:hypothetical protein
MGTLSREDNSRTAYEDLTMEAVLQHIRQCCSQHGFQVFMWAVNGKHPLDEDYNQYDILGSLEDDMFVDAKLILMRLDFKHCHIQHEGPTWSYPVEHHEEEWDNAVLGEVMQVLSETYRISWTEDDIMAAVEYWLSNGHDGATLHRVPDAQGSCLIGNV